MHKSLFKVHDLVVHSHHISDNGRVRVLEENLQLVIAFGITLNAVLMSTLEEVIAGW